MNSIINKLIPETLAGKYTEEEGNKFYDPVKIDENTFQIKITEDHEYYVNNQPLAGSNYKSEKNIIFYKGSVKSFKEELKITYSDSYYETFTYEIQMENRFKNDEVTFRLEDTDKNINWRKEDNYAEMEKAKKDLKDDMDDNRRRNNYYKRRKSKRGRGDDNWRRNIN